MSDFVRQGKDSDAGFTIVELMVALVVLAVGLLPLFGMFGQGMSGIHRGGVTTIANQLAQEEIESVRMLTYGNIGIVGGNPSGTIQSSSTVVKSGVTFIVARSVTWVDDTADGTGGDDDNPKDYKKFEVEVSWSLPAPAGTTKFGTYLKPYTPMNHPPVAHAPVVTPAYPPGGGGYIKDQVTLMAQASDDDGTISEVQFLYRLDGDSTWTVIGSTSSMVGDYYQYSWDTVGKTGTYLVMAKAWDNLGAVDSTYASVVIDNTFPEALIDPPPGPVTSPTASYIYIAGKATDVPSVSFTEYYIMHNSPTQPDSWSYLSCGYSGHYGIPHSAQVSGVSPDNLLAYWNVSSLADGTYTLKLTVNDKAEHNTVTTQSITIAVPPPTPILSAAVGGGTINLSWNDDTLDGAPYSFPSDFYTFKIWKKPSAEAQWTLTNYLIEPSSATSATITHDSWKYKIRAIDTSGNWSESNEAP